MPKKRTQTTPLERQLFILDCIVRSGSLDQKEIEIRIFERFELERNDASKKMVLRDLQSLAKQNKVKVKSLDRYNQEVDYDSPEFYKSVYTSLDDDQEVIGHAAFKEFGVNIHSSKILRPSVSVRKIESIEDGFSRHIILALPSIASDLAVWIEKDALPLKIFFGRVQESYRKNISEFMSSLSKRCIYLDIQSKEISSLKDLKKPGHCFLEMSTNATSKIVDLDSTNGTRFSPTALNQEQISELFGNKLNKTIQSLTSSKSKELNSVSSSGVFCDRPLLFIIGSGFPVILI